MARKATGTITKTKTGRWQAIVTLANGTRKRLPPFPAGTSEAMAREKAAHYAEKYRSIQPPKPAAVASGEAEKWWKAFHEHRAGQGKYSVENMHEVHIKPVLSKHPREWTKADCEAVRDALDAKIAAGYWERDGKRYSFGWKRAWNVWTVFTSACKAASASKNKALRCREDNPCESVLPPERGRAKAKQWLYPTEFAALMACEDIPRERRRFYALLAYTYLRPSELAALLVQDVELEVGLLNVTKTWNFTKREPKDYPKTHAGVRPVPIEPAIASVLRMLAEGRPAHERLIQAFPNPTRWARTLRADLRRAGIDRASLFEDTPTMKQITLYDLRASGITWRTLRRDDPRDIQRDAGHEKYATTEGYVRAASVYRDRVGEPFGALPAELLDREGDHRKRSPRGNSAEFQCRQRDLNPHWNHASAENKLGHEAGVSENVSQAERKGAERGRVIAPLRSPNEALAGYRKLLSEASAELGEVFA